MDLGTALTTMNSRGYCLWVGAGLSLYAAQGGSGKVPLWSDLAQQLEKEADIAAHRVGLSFPERLDLILHKLGRARFQTELRKRVHDPLANSLLAAARACGTNANDPIPPEVRRIAKLGARANPIVNFNIEVITSCLLGGAEPHAIKCFIPPVPGAANVLNGHGQYTSSTSRHNRAIYHPHGAVTVGGICVMTATEYRAMRGTLALQLAVHAAFRSPLAIVGMSLDDEYLREQLAEFRDQVDDVFWFRTMDPTVSDELERWCLVNRVCVIDVKTWPAFWDQVDLVLPAPPEEGVVFNWLNLVSEADDAVRTGHRHREWMIHGFRKLGMNEADLIPWKQALQLQGLPVPDTLDEAELEASAPKDEEALVPIFAHLSKILRSTTRAPGA